MRALIVEDSNSYKRIINQILEELDVEPRFYESGEEALNAIEDGKFDFVCVDLYLPDINGFELCRRIRGNAANSTTPILMLTTQEKAEFLEDSFDTGLTEIIYKSDLDNMKDSLTTFVQRMRRVYSGQVLLVEDSRTTAQLLIYMLEKMKLNIDHYDNAEDAFKQFTSKDYDIVITDMVLEGAISGIRLLRKIRAIDDERKYIPVLGISASEGEATRIEMLRSGANDYISKPVLEEELIARVGNLIQSKKLLDDLRASEKQLEILSITDELTGLYNRHYLNKTADKMIANAVRYQFPLTAIMIDLDKFKQINDNLGHEAGDSVLKTVGNILSTNSRKGDLAARMGGDEFILLLDHCSLDEATAKADKIRQKLESVSIEGVQVTASFGVKSMNEDSDFQSLYKEADHLMYDAKEAGGNQINT